MARKTMKYQENRLIFRSLIRVMQLRGWRGERLYQKIGLAAGVHPNTVRNWIEKQTAPQNATLAMVVAALKMEAY